MPRQATERSIETRLGRWLASAVTCFIVLTEGPAAHSLPSACVLDLPSYSSNPVPFPERATYVTPEGRIRVVGYNDMLEILTAINELFIVTHPGFTFELVLKGTKTAPPALASGESAFAPMGAEFSTAQLDSYRKTTRSDRLTMIKIAHDSLDPRARSSPLAIFVNGDNPLASLSIDEAKRVFAAVGEQQAARKWGELGLPGDWVEKPIHPIGLGDATALGSFMRNHKFDGLPFSSSFTGLAQSTEVIAAVTNDPLAIGFADLNLARPQAKVLALSEHPGGSVSSGSAEDLRAGRYPLDRHLLIYLRRSEEGNLDSFLREYVRLILSCEGQTAIAQQPLAYLPLSRSEVEEELLKLK